MHSFNRFPHIRAGRRYGVVGLLRSETIAQRFNPG